jgi:hypothetical protein
MVSLPRGQTVNTFSFNTFANLSDRSYPSRLDYNVKLLTHISLDLYGDVHYGTDGGKFRFGSTPPQSRRAQSRSRNRWSLPRSSTWASGSE